MKKQEGGGRAQSKEAVIALNVLKAKIATAPMLQRYGIDRPTVDAVYSSNWVVSAASPFTSRTLKTK